jgi:F0F1-type ATP synthase membrane subunit b/b'
MGTFLAVGLLDDLGVNLKVWATQVAIFVTTFIVLSRLLFSRVLAAMQAREEEIRKSEEAIAHDRAEVARLAKEYEAHVTRIDKEAYEKLQAAVREALAAAQATVAQAQAAAKQEVQNAQEEIGREKREALVRVREGVVRLTHEVAEKVMETRLDPGAAAAAVRKLVSERS